MTDRSPPHSREAEQQIIAAVFRLADARDDLFSKVRAEDLYLDAHQIVWRAASELHNAGQPADLVAVAERLKAAGVMANVGAGYMAELWESNPTGMGWEYYADIVADCATRRRLIHLCSEASRDAFDGVAPAAEMVGEVERRVFALGEGHTADAEPVSLTEAMADAMFAMNERMAGRGERPVSTGFAGLDNVVGGFRRGELTIVAARPSVGKSAIALNFSLHAMRSVPVLFFSQEMSAEELANRALAFRASVPLHVIGGTKPPTEDEIAGLWRAAGQREPGELWIDDRSHLTAAEVARATRRAVRRHGVRLVVVDYLQRMQHDRRAGETTTRQVGETAKAMKTLARNANVPVVCLAQLNREVEGRGDGRPKLSDLRDSGEIEQEADVVMLLHPHPPNPTQPSRQTIDVLVEKQRNGPKSAVTLDYRRPFTRFEEQSFPI